MAVTLKSSKKEKKKKKTKGIFTQMPNFVQQICEHDSSVKSSKETQECKTEMNLSHKL